jgi:hypothetical protein
MSDINSSDSTKIYHSLNKKIKYLQTIRHEIKKRRIFFDETRERFGLDELSQLVKVKNTSEIKGYPFKGCKGSYNKVTRGIKFGLKVMPIETKYDKSEHPCYLETIILKHLTDNIVNKGISPHLVYYLGTQKVSNKSKSLKMLNLKRLEVDGSIRTHSNMLISEYVDGGSLDNWIYNTYENDKEIKDEQWKNIVFQLIYTIAIIQKYYKMMHNDFHYGNILIDTSIKPGGYLVYNIDKKTYYIKNTGIIPRLWDFEFSMVYSDKIHDAYPNKFILGPYEYDRKLHKTIITDKEIDNLSDRDLNVPFNYSEVYDVHYFLTSLLDLYISQELFDWIIELYPREVIPDDNDSTSTSKSSSSTDSFMSSKSSVDSSANGSANGSVNGSVDGSVDEESSRLYKSTDDNKYLLEGRLMNGAEDVFELPTPLELLKNKFFDVFTIKPDDFDEKTAIYFNAGF